MFYKMIENKCTQWYESERCTVKNLIEYIEKTGQMRDAQIEAIKVYLFLKIACECKPLTQLFRQGFFNSIDLNEIELSKSTREYLFQNPAAATLFEYACLTNDKGEQVSEKLEKQIKKDPTGIDYNEFFRNAFYGVSYTDYLFSLPMGAGKTYLMAAFIYLDLYFAYNEPTNPSFAHNFIIFAPSGLKSSVVPSLKTIQNFNPSWILPEPAATDIKRMISFEVLDQSKTAKKSNKTKNPNVQKIANHQPLSELFGLVAVTNAEKVILERIQEKQGQINMFEESEDDKDRQANELRNLIGKLPSLSIFIDEVHHAVSDEIKLRAVVTRWAQNHTVNSVIGFSGTPYLDKVEKIKVVDSLSIGTAEITNIVYYYPLIDGVGNFLKRPVVKIADIADSSLIIEKGVREFLDTYKDTVYADGLLIKVFQKIEENIQQYSVEKLSRYSNAMSGIGLSSLIEEWIVQNELTEKIYTETELLYVITELYLQICGDFRYQEHIQSICKKWIDGQTPMEINNKETIGIAEVESLCNKRISYEMNFLIGNICDLIEVDGENEEQVDQRNILTLLQKKVKYGVPNMTAISICESVFNDRLLAIELAQILSDANIGTDKILNMLKAHSEEIFSCLDSYPEYFKDRLSVLMK